MTEVTFSSDSSRTMACWLNLAVSGSALGLECRTSSLRHNSSWTCLSTSFYLLFINSQALICTKSWNSLRWKCHLTCLWIGQDFCSSLIGSDLIFAVSTDGMGKECQKSCGLSRASRLIYFLWSAMMATTMTAWTGHLLPNPYFLTKICVACCIWSI